MENFKEKNSAQVIVRPLTFKYVAALGLLAAQAAINFFILRFSIQEGDGLAAIVNRAGRQRMLLHRTTIHAERFVFSFDDTARSQARQELLADAHALEKTHHELMPPKPANGVGASDEVRAIYDDSPWLLDSELRNYLIHVHSLADADEEELNYSDPHFAYMRNPQTVDKICQGLEAVVDVYERHSNAKTRQLNLLAIWSFASTLALLALSGWWVFRPMVRKVRNDVAALDSLNETLELRVAERTAEAEERADRLTASQAALRESQALYFSLVHHMPMSMLRKDCFGRFTFANARFCELMQMSLDEIVGRTDADFYAEELAAKYCDDDDRVMETGDVLHDVEEYETPDGRRLFVEVLKVPLRDAADNIAGTQTMFWDVTDRKLAEERALQAERLAAIGQMVTGVAHESRNALQQIQACSQTLKWELNGDVKKQGLIADLQRAEERLLRLFEELRNYAAPLKLDCKLCDLRTAAKAAWSTVETHRNGRDATFVQRESNVSTQCMADRMKLEQVFRNLFENSVTASDEPVRIDVAYERLSNGALQLTVSDNGPGLSPEQQTRIFEPFFTTKSQGTGLGMAIVKRIVNAHGGQISVESGPQGALFTITLPSDELRKKTKERSVA